MKRAACCIAASIAAFTLVELAPALAQEGEGTEAEFSVYTVARVKVLDGSVWVRPSDGRDWVEYLSNSPIPPRSRVSVPEGSEAELQFHGGQFVLLTPGTDLEVRDLQEGKSAFRLRAGEIRFDLPPDDFAPVSIRVPGGAVAQFPVPGNHSLAVTDRDETRLVVHRGRAVVIVDGDEHRLRSGDEAVIGRDVTVGRYRGGADESVEPPPPSAEEAPGDAPPVVVSELREYGEWIYVPAYGNVWRPRVAAGWSPYVYGRWVWILPYGWTWISYEPWGWYPYRCGYWVTDPVFGWVWSPYNSFVSVNFGIGSNRYPHHRVFFRPATVRFVPEGRNVRWVPLRPGERYRSAGFARGDARLSGWNRPLDSGRVFVRGGADRREWRDYSAVHAEHQAEFRKTHAAQSRPDTRTVRPENRAVRPPDRQPARRPATKADRGNGATRNAVPKAGNVEPQAHPSRGAPATRPPEREKARVPAPMTAPVPGKVELQTPPPRGVPATRPAEREKVRVPAPMTAPVPGNVEPQSPPPHGVPATRPAERENARVPEPMSTPVPGKVEPQASPPRGVPATRPAEREKVREVEPKEDRSGGPPAGRSPDPGVRGQWGR
jgi:ferric-dicitrate binding protein FerR (iron transport regulator)